MNIVESRVLDWLIEKNIAYEKTDWGFTTSAFNIKCIPSDQSVPVYKEKNDRIVSEWALPAHIQALDNWLQKPPTLRIERLEINADQTDQKILVTAKHDQQLIAESEFWQENSCLYWHDTRYHGYHVPGWLGKSLKAVLKLDLHLPIETITNAIDSSYHRIGFKTVEQVDIRTYFERSKIPNRIPFTHPEHILMWRLRYDSIGTL